jgi:hypothetical protein
MYFFSVCATVTAQGSYEFSMRPLVAVQPTLVGVHKAKHVIDTCSRCFTRLLAHSIEAFIAAKVSETDFSNSGVFCFVQPIALRRANSDFDRLIAIA